MQQKSIEEFVEQNIQEGEIAFIHADENDRSCEVFQATADSYSLLSKTQPQLYGFLVAQGQKIQEIRFSISVYFFVTILCLAINFDYSHYMNDSLLNYVRGGSSVVLWFVLLFVLISKEIKSQENYIRTMRPQIETKIKEHGLTKNIVLQTLADNKWTTTIKKVLADDFAK